LEALLPYLPTDRRHALARGETLPDRASGSALFVDISGFTPLAEALAHDLGPQRGAEELTHYLNKVYDALIGEVDMFRGSVIGFSGDAVTCWFEGDRGLRATACALQMHRTMEQLSTIGLPTGERLPLSVKAGVAVGTARRFLVGDPNQQLFDVLAGRVLDEMAEAEHQAAGGEVVLAQSAMQALEDQVEIQRTLNVDGSRLGVAAAVKADPEHNPWPDLPPDSLTEAQLRPWLLAPVYERLRAGQGEFLAELRPAVALFLRFTGIDYDADQSAVEKFDDFIRRVQRILGKYRGTLVDINTGDKGSYLYLAFGAPVAHEDDVERAAAAALDLRTEAADLAYISSVQIGINRGRMRTGAYGGRTRRTYGVLGDATNLAARLMTAAEPGEILMSRSALEEAEQAFVWSQHPAIKVKGKIEPIGVVSLLGRSDRNAHDRPARRHLLPMVGRDRELAIIEEKIDLALGGKGQIVGITAEAGMGKSRLIAEAVRASRSRGLAAYSGECKSYGMHSSYLVWSGIWRDLFELDASRPSKVQISELEARIDALNPALLPRLPLLGPLLNLPIPDNEVTRQLDAKLRKASLELMLVELLRPRAQRASLIIVLEDTHWIDPLSADLMKVVGHALSDLPLLVLLAYRSEREGEAHQSLEAKWPNFTEIALTELGAEQAEDWISIKLRQLFGPDLRPPRAFVERLLTRAEGNPFYIEEVLNYLRDHAISPQDSEALSQLDLPASLHSLVLTRIDQLGERPRSALRVASVFGMMFRAGHLLGAYPELDGAHGIEAELNDLDRKGFIEPEFEAEDTYFFKHNVIQEVAYESLTFALRRNLHGSIGAFVERTYAETLDRVIDLLAYHYFRGEAWPKALDYNLETARRAQRAYANESAVAAAWNALEAAGHLEPSSTTKLKVLSCQELLGEVLDWQARYTESVEAFTKMLRTAEDLGDVVAQARAWHGAAEAQMHQGNLREAIAAAEQEEQVAAGAEQELALAKARWMQAWGAFRLGEIERALQLAEALPELSIRLEDRGQQAENLNLLGVLHWASGRYAESERYFNQALEVFREIGDERRGMPLLNNLGVIAESRGDLESALEKYQGALSIARQIGNRDGEMVYLGNLGGVRVRLEDYPGAEAELRSVLKMSDPEGMDVMADILSLLAEACLGQGRVDEALDHSRKALDIAIRVESQDDLGAVWRVLGMVGAALKEPPVLEHSPLGPNRACDAGICFAESERIFRELGREDELARTLRSWARHELRLGNQELAEAKWKEARELFENVGATHELNRMAEFPEHAARPA
jgi:class 3 adenylate cyclase/tetratricopeptide (TPR) repeat protein